MSKPIHIQEIVVNRMYGRTFGLHLEDLGPGINIIWGANGSGKTTIAHAIQTVLLRKYQYAANANVAATLLIGSDTLRFNVDGPRRHSSQDGQEMNWDSAPKLIRPDSYHFSLHDLLLSESRGKEFAEAILREGSGGFDLRAARESLKFKDKNPGYTKVSKSFTKAQKDLQAVRNDQNQLRTRKERYHHLETRLASAQQAAGEVDLLQKTLAWQLAHRSWLQAHNALDSYPHVIRQRMDLSTIVANARDRSDSIARLKEQRRLHSSDLDRVERERKSNSLYPDGLPTGVMDVVAGRISRLQALDIKSQTLRKDLAAGQQSADNAWADLKMDEEGPSVLTRDHVQRLYDLITRRIKLQGTDEAFEVLHSILGVGEDTDHDESLLRIRQAQNLVIQWITAQRPRVPRNASLLLWAALIGSGVLSILSGLAISPLAYAGLSIPVIIGLGLYLLKNTRQKTGIDEELRRQFPDLSQRIKNGEADSVLDELLGERSTQTLKRDRQNHWQATSQERSKLAKGLQDLEQDASSLAAETGLTLADASPAEVYVLKRLWDWREHTDNVKKLEGQYKHNITEFDAELSALNNVLAENGLPTAQDVQQAVAQVNALRSLSDAWKELSGKWDTSQSQLRQTDRTLAQAEAEFADLFEQLELDAGDMDELRKCAILHAEYLEAQKAEVAAKAVLDQARRAVADAPGFHEDILEQENLEQTLEAARLRSNEREELQNEITTIQLDIDRAESGRTLEQALAKLNSRRDALISACDQDTAQAVGAVLARHLDDFIRKQKLPRVFERARKNFLEITRGQFELEFDLDGKFSAMDTRDSRRLDLEELSSGTRVQLLLSVRMAFVQEQELDYRLPVTLDETLGNSDDERARVVIETLAHVAQDRQVFYFTAQGDEVAKWKQHTNDPNIRVIELTDEIRPIPVDPDLLPERRPATPDSGLSHSAYGKKLRPPRWNGRMSVSHIHLWYLLEDTRLLDRLIAQGITAWGPLLALYDTGQVKLEASTYSNLSTLAKALEAWQSNWRIGRGKPVDRSAIEDSGAVSDHFMFDLLTKSEECNHDASELLLALRNGQVKGFLKKKIEDLEQYLGENGYLTPEPARSGEDIQNAMLSEIADDLKESGVSIDAINRMLDRVGTGPPVV